MKRMAATLATLTFCIQVWPAAQGEVQKNTPAPAAPACSDGIDNDGDGCIDYPCDGGCLFPSDDSEADAGCRQALSTDYEVIKFYERTPGRNPTYTMASTDPRLLERRPDPLSASNRDFTGVPGVEFYDVYYSNEDGTFNASGGYLTIEAVYDRTLPARGGLNIAGVSLHTVEAGNAWRCATRVTSSVVLGDNAIPGSEPDAADGDMSTFTVMGNTVGQNQRLRITLAFAADGDPCVVNGVACNLAPPPACSDGIDNDGDGCADFPCDAGCADALDNSEAEGGCNPVCTASVCPATSAVEKTFGCTYAGGYQQGQPYDRITIGPGEEGETFAEKQISIRVWIRSCAGTPQVGIPEANIVLWNSNLCLCAGGNIADAPTDADGSTTFTGTIRGGGCAPFLDVYAYGVFVGSVPVKVNSPDLASFGASPCYVDAADVAQVARYLGPNPSLPYDICADFNEDGIIDLLDLRILHQHIGATCSPGSQSSSELLQQSSSAAGLHAGGAK